MRSNVADPSLAEQGVRRVEWAERAMPVLGEIRTGFARTRPFAGIRIAVCMHVTTETALLLRALVDGGAQVTLCASNPLSTQDDVAAALARRYGVGVFARHGVDLATYYADISAALDIGPTLVLDDGCDLITTLHETRRELIPAVRAGCESTTTGVLRLRRMSAEGSLGFPVVAVNDTATKRLVDNRYGTGQSTIDAILRATNTLLAGRVVVVAGYGSCGKGVAERARGMGAHVVVTEVDPAKALDATLQGYRVLPMAEAAPLGDVFVTVTGNRDVITMAHVGFMRDGAVLANSGHFDVEIDVRALAAAAVEKREAVRPHADEYVLGDGRRIVVLAAGRVVNLGAAEGHPPAVMDVAFAAQALTARWLVTHAAEIEAGVHAVPGAIDDEVARRALGARGICIDVLTEAQQDYLGSWRSGS